MTPTTIPYPQFLIIAFVVAAIVVIIHRPHLRLVVIFVSVIIVSVIVISVVCAAPFPLDASSPPASGGDDHNNIVVVIVVIPQ